MIPENILRQCKQLISEYDTILIGAGAGLSAAGGLIYSGKRFTDNFADYITKYKLKDMYSAAFYPYSTLEARWGYFSKYIKINRFDVPVGQVYHDLLELVKNKNYFVITTNADAQFEKSGFDLQKLFAVQGDYSKFQCETPCHNNLYDNENMVKAMVEQQTNFSIPSVLLPKCPVCGANLVPHLRKDNAFVENEEWEQANERYKNFVRESVGKKMLLLELGVGFNTPSIIRWSFEQLSISNPKHTLMRINKDDAQASMAIFSKNILVQGDIADFMTFVK